jgi:hypothetical protein
MNIETLAEYIEEFQIDIIASGFKRDVQDYVSSLPSNQANIVALREIAEKLREALKCIYASDLPDALDNLLPTKKARPFTEKNYLDEVQDLLRNKTIPQSDLFNKLHQIVQQLQTDLQQNEAEINRIKTFISSYVKEDSQKLTSAGHALISIILKDIQTISSLKELTKTLSAWNRILPLYHRLLKSESPEDIRLVEIQNGSVDFIVNVDVDVAVNMAELFKTAFKCYAAYLLYKKMVKPITDTYLGNKKLIAAEEERERELLNNIGVAIEGQIKEQHEKAKGLGVTSAHPEKMIEQVTNLVTSHVVRGNDIKLLALPEADNQSGETEKSELREASNEAKNARRALPPEDVKKLLEVYGAIKTEPNQ